jgi:hypothetical protein
LKPGIRAWDLQHLLHTVPIDALHSSYSRVVGQPQKNGELLGKMKERGLNMTMEGCIVLYSTLCQASSSKNIKWNTTGYDGAGKGLTLDAINDHCKSAQHKEAIERRKTQHGIQIMMQRANEMNVETLESGVSYKNGWIHSFRNAYFIAKNHLSYSLMPKLCAFVRQSIGLYSGAIDSVDFEDESGPKYSRDKDATDMIQTIAEDLADEAFEEVKKGKYFSLMVDESNDCSDIKNMALFIRSVDVDTGEVIVRMLDMVEVKDVEANTLFKEIESQLNLRNFSYQNMVGFGSDGCSVMTGSIKGVVTQLKAKYQQLLSSYCAAHRLALSAKDAEGPTHEYLVSIMQSVTTYFNRS